MIEKVGTKVTETQVGDRVCGLNFGNFRAFAEYIAVSQDRIYKMPDAVSYEEAAFMEPVALAHMSLELTNPTKEQNVLILGQGPLGLVHTQLFAIAGANILAVDVVPARLDLSRRFGAKQVINPKGCNVFKEISNITDHVDIVVEATGSSQTVTLLSKLAERGVRMILFSVWNPEIRQFRVSEKNAEICKVFGANRKDCLAALELISQRNVDLSFLVSSRFRLKDIENAYKFALNPCQGKQDPKAIGALILPH